MSIVNRLWSIVVFTSKRIFAQKGLTLAIIIGITTAVALTMSIPIYANAAYQNILETDVIASAQDQTENTNTSAASSFSFLFRYIGSWNGPISWEKLQPIKAYFEQKIQSDLLLTVKERVNYYKTAFYPFVPINTNIYSGIEYKPLAYLSLGALGNWNDHIDILEGTSPTTSSTDSTKPIDVWIHEDLATEIGLQAGEEYSIIASINGGKDKSVIPVRIAGIWAAKDNDDPYWFYKVAEFRYSLLTTEENFINRVLPLIENNVDQAIWFLQMDNTQVQSEDVPILLNRIRLTRQEAAQLLPNIRLDISPEQKLVKYQQAASSLMVFLYILNIPILAMILTFIGLVGGMVVSQRQNEIAVLRSRGTSMFQVLGFAILEGIVVGGISLAIGTYLATIVASFFGRVNSFLDFSSLNQLKVAVTSQALYFGITTAALAVLAVMAPTFNAAKHTIISYKQEQARQMRPPWWQRVYLDFLLMIPAVYGTYLLRQQGGLNITVSKGVISQDPFQNPLLVLVPSIGIFALTLMTLRLLPFLMIIISKIISRTRSIGFLAATRHLARTTGNYHAPLILLVLTLSLSTFTATLAQTLDRHLHDQLYYSVGSDAQLIEFGEAPAGSSPSTSVGFSSTNQNENSWVFVPVTEHLRVPEIQAAARIATNNVSIYPPTGFENGILMGIDRLDFPLVAFWRKDFSSSSLGSLMNQLALTTEGVLLPRSFLEKYNLKPGDDLRVEMFELGASHEFLFKIVGAFEYFPTWYPDEGPLIVGNLDYIFEMTGGEFPYDVWVRTEQNTNYDKLSDDLENFSLRVLYAKVAVELLKQAQARPERQGLFGLLSVGFTALALMTVLGFLLYAYFSFRRRFIELGILRAIGLSTWQMMVLLGVELAFLLGIGLAIGTALGVWVSNLFIPYLQIGTAQTAHVPPFLIQIDWTSVFRIYILFGALFIIALVILAFLLLRMKIFQAVKLGETV
jgi:putative ABC transport system permease protein